MFVLFWNRKRFINKYNSLVLCSAFVVNWNKYIRLFPAYKHKPFLHLPHRCVAQWNQARFSHHHTALTLTLCELLTRFTCIKQNSPGKWVTSYKLLPKFRGRPGARQDVAPEWRYPIQYYLKQQESIQSITRRLHPVDASSRHIVRWGYVRHCC